MEQTPNVSNPIITVTNTHTHTHAPAPIRTFSPYIMLISNHNISRSKPMSSSLNVTSSFHNYRSKSNNIFISKIFIIVCNELMAFLLEKKKAISSDRQRERVEIPRAAKWSELGKRSDKRVLRKASLPSISGSLTWAYPPRTPLTDASTPSQYPTPCLYQSHFLPGSPVCSRHISSAFLNWRPLESNPPTSIAFVWTLLCGGGGGGARRSFGVWSEMKQIWVGVRVGENL